MIKSKWQKGRKIGTNGKRSAVALTEVDKRRVMDLRKLITNTSNSLLIMPRDNLNHYYVPGGYGQCTISRMSRMAYSHSANSTAMYARPYATTDSLIQRVDGSGEDWYHDEANDLHLRDFIWFTRMQMAQRMRNRGT